MSEIILGSASPRRQEIMRASGYEFKILTAGSDEEVHPSWDVYDTPVNLAVHKAELLLPKISEQDFILVTSDTVVILDGKIIGKPIDREDAINILRTLSGRTHEVVTGVCITSPDGNRSFSDLTRVTFRKISMEEIIHYVDNYEVMDKAGAYAIQEWIGMVAVTGIEGSYFNVMGLPIHKVYQAIEELSGR